MFSENDQADNKARIMLIFSGINQGSIIERYNNNDTIISESGVFFSFSQTDGAVRDRKIIEKLKIINFREKRLEIPFYQSNDPNDEGIFIFKRMETSFNILMKLLLILKIRFGFTFHSLVQSLIMKNTRILLMMLSQILAVYWD